MQFFVPSLAIVALAASASAQLTNVLPTSANGIGGSTANAFPWGMNTTAWPGLRIQCVYDSSHFTAAPVPINAPILITSIGWRANDVANTTSWAGGQYNSASVALATAAVDHTLTSTAWASNVGPDYTVVYNGVVTVLGGTGNGVGVPGPVVVTIPVVPPFLYDPNAGDLVVDTDYLFPGNVTGALPGMDVHATNVLARRVYSSSLYPNANGVDSAAPVIEIGYTPVGGSPASNQSLGLGCVRSFTSFYELFGTPANFDLGGTAITMIPNGGGYVVIQSGSFLPVGSVQAVPTALTLGDDAEVVQPLTIGSFPGPSGPWTSMSVISNGVVSQGTGNSLVAAPSPGTLLGAPQTGFYTQGDWDPVGGTGSGTIWFEESASVISITWDAVKSWNVAGTNTFQMQFYPSGLVTIAWVSMTPLGANGGVLVGYSPGGASLDPGNMDVSGLGTNALTLGATDTAPLSLLGTTRPVTGTNWNLTTSNIPATGVIGVDIFGLSDPNIPDLSFLGMPGCGLRASLDVLLAYPVTGPTHSYTLPIPSNPALLGVPVYTTGAVFQAPPVNAFGAITSNGIKGTIGNV